MAKLEPLFKELDKFIEDNEFEKAIKICDKSMFSVFSLFSFFFSQCETLADGSSSQFLHYKMMMLMQ
jgi:hypothetical protein